MRMTAEQVASHQARVSGVARTVLPQPRGVAKSKYRAQPTVVDGRRFASKTEGRRYSQLRLLQAAGEIRDLRTQTRWPLRIDGTLLCHYVSDFDYFRGEVHQVEDVKGGKSLPIFKLKSKLFSVLYHPLIVTEIRHKGRGST